MDVNKMRLQYAGAIGLLCELSTRVRDEDDKEMLDQAVADWCAMTGWTWRRILDRVEVFPPELAEVEPLATGGHR